MKPKGTIYFLAIKGGDRIKIGFSTEPRSRFASLQSWCPYELETLHTLKGHKIIESYCHAVLAKHRVRGEWFARCPDVLDFIERVRISGVVEGCPAAPRRRYDQFNYAACIPAVWPNRAEMARDTNIIALPVHSMTPSTSKLCKIIVAARALGTDLRMSDLLLSSKARAS